MNSTMKKPGLLLYFLLVLTLSLQAQIDKGITGEAAATSDKRLAMVVGNSLYQNQSTLPNTLNDADSMAHALQACGFEVLKYKDAGLNTMDKTLTDMSDRLSQSKYQVVLYFYSGHGIQVDGDNYLIPIDAKLSQKVDVKYQALAAQRIIEYMEIYQVPTKILLLDACRDNPFPRNWTSRGGLDEGLASMSAPQGTFIGFAAAPGQRSFDGGELGNGVYTKAILQHLSTPDLSIDELFTRVAASTQQIIARYGQVQVPFKNSSLTANFYFQEKYRTQPDTPGVPTSPDRDGDGTPDASDECPDTPGSVRGCPDGDFDGIPDKDDACPFQAGTAQYNGCPAPADRDKDDVPDDLDQCPDKYGKLDWQGCPDSDDDGVPDHRDDCPDEKGDPARNGCPAAEAATYTDPLAGTMVLVKGGTFKMGCTSEQQVCTDDEKPAHNVTLRDYYIGQTEVTQAQWRAVMGSDPTELYHTGCDECPVERVSNEDIQQFLTKLNAQSGGARYRLPTEAEWEYAARGGKQSKGYLYAGSDNLDDVAWYGYEKSYKTTHPVKGKSPNELGLYDMSGNVYELCSDWYGSYSADSQTNPIGPSSGSGRVGRGGSWGNDPQVCRVADRGSVAPGYRGNGMGVRLARTK
ncbi:MAG: SUMF1/EgtB/PvdO family nonheme iron enzyme [Lewinellaceae bacterium]|nr:SUMF1/EgtB/PvdO family nonheme iron enzyme [Lewinellaceae bacterium]